MDYGKSRKVPKIGLRDLHSDEQTVKMRCHHPVMTQPKEDLVLNVHKAISLSCVLLGLSALPALAEQANDKAGDAVRLEPVTITTNTTPAETRKEPTVTEAPAERGRITMRRISVLPKDGNGLVSPVCA